jgi:probable phosphoglycerate mutase
LRLVLVRHGETEWSATGRHTSRTDVPLTTRGEAQAVALRASLAGWDFVEVWASPMERARHTATLAGFGARVVDEPDLCEWDYGIFEGRTTADIRGEVPDWSLWRDGAPGGETPTDVESRADAVIGRARSTVGDVLAFGHGHILRVIASRWIDLDASHGRSLALGTGTVSVLGWERDEPAIERWNQGRSFGS